MLFQKKSYHMLSTKNGVSLCLMPFISKHASSSENDSSFLLDSLAAASYTCDGISTHATFSPLHL